MKKSMFVLSVLSLFVVALVAVQAEEKDEAKPSTLKGRLVCGKCTLKITDGCSNVLEVTKGKKKTHYILDDKAKREKYHKAICPPGSATKNVTVTGVVYKKGDHFHVKNPKVKVGKKDG